VIEDNQMKDRIERVVQIAKEKGELRENTAWWELKNDLKRYATHEEKEMIDDVWWKAEREEYLPKWDERFLIAVSGEYKTQEQLEYDKQLRQYQLQQAALQNQLQQAALQNQLYQPGAIYPAAQNQQNPYQNAGLLNGLKGIFGGK